MENKNLAFGKRNFIFLGIGLAVVVLGFILMAGGNSDPNHFDSSIFDAIHIKVAPIVCFLGFVSIIVAVVIKPKDKE